MIELVIHTSTKIFTVFHTDQVAIVCFPLAPVGECHGAVAVGGVSHWGVCRVCAASGVQTHTF